MCFNTLFRFDSLYYVTKRSFITIIPIDQFIPGLNSKAKVMNINVE